MPLLPYPQTVPVDLLHPAGACGRPVAAGSLAHNQVVVINASHLPAALAPTVPADAYKASRPELVPLRITHNACHCCPAPQTVPVDLLHPPRARGRPAAVGAAAAATGRRAGVGRQCVNVPGHAVVSSGRGQGGMGNVARVPGTCRCGGLGIGAGRQRVNVPGLAVMGGGRT